MKTAVAAAVERGASGVRVLHKTLGVLEVVKSQDSGYRLADLARAVELPKATVYRVVSTLEKRGYLDRTRSMAPELKSVCARRSPKPSA
jgi:IclR family mhp operon transcriptional activator